MCHGEGGAGPLASAASELQKIGHSRAGYSHDRCHLTLQFFAILEANYPETVKNLVIIRGEFVTKMTPAWRRETGVR